jgi:hypothetical protein
MFDIGETVLCVDHSVKPEFIMEFLHAYQNWVTKNQKYIVREVYHNDNIVTGVLLEGVVNKPIYFKIINRTQEPAFATWRFRKAEPATVTSEESVEESLFTELEELGIPILEPLETK